MKQTFLRNIDIRLELMTGGKRRVAEVITLTATALDDPKLRRKTPQSRKNVKVVFTASQ